MLALDLAAEQAGHELAETHPPEVLNQEAHRQRLGGNLHRTLGQRAPCCLPDRGAARCVLSICRGRRVDAGQGEAGRRVAGDN